MLCELWIDVVDPARLSAFDEIVFDQLAKNGREIVAVDPESLQRRSVQVDDFPGLLNKSSAAFCYVFRVDVVPHIHLVLWLTQQSYN
jgi:hypothetical protein